MLKFLVKVFRVKSVIQASYAVLQHSYISKQMRDKGPVFHVPSSYGIYPRYLDTDLSKQCRPRSDATECGI